MQQLSSELQPGAVLSYLDRTETAGAGPTAQNLWTLVFVLALRKIKLDFFHGGTDRNETLGTQGQPSNLTTPQPPMRGILRMPSWRSRERTRFPPPAGRHSPGPGGTSGLVGSINLAWSD